MIFFFDAFDVSNASSDVSEGLSRLLDDRRLYMDEDLKRLGYLGTSLRRKARRRREDDARRRETATSGVSFHFIENSFFFLQFARRRRRIVRCARHSSFSYGAMSVVASVRVT